MVSCVVVLSRVYQLSSELVLKQSILADYFYKSKKKAIHHAYERWNVWRSAVQACGEDDVPWLENPLLSVCPGDMNGPLSLVRSAPFVDMIDRCVVPDIQIEYTSIGFKPISDLCGKY